MAGGFKDLRAWQVSMDLVEEVYRLTDKFPGQEKFGLVDQMRRASVSVPSNIAEGHGRLSRLDFRRFQKIALGSACEVETQLLIAVRLGYCEKDAVKPALKMVDETGKILRGLIRSEASRNAPTASYSLPPTDSTATA